MTLRALTVAGLSDAATVAPAVSVADAAVSTAAKWPARNTLAAPVVARNMYGTARSPPLQFDSLDPPDTPYALVFGLYVALLAAPALVGVAALSVPLGPAGLYVAFLAAVTGVTVAVTWLVGRWRGFPERAGGSRLSWLFPVLGAPVAGAYFLAAFGGGPLPSGVAFVGVFAATLAMILGVGVRAMSRNRYTAALVDDEPVTCEWEAGWPRRARLAAVGTGVALITVGLLALADLLPGGPLVEYAGLAGYAVGPALLSVGRPWTYRATAVGLERRLPVVRSIDRWDELAGFEETESALVIRRAAWWRPSIRCSWDEIGDRDAVVDALRRRIGRR